MEQVRRAKTRRRTRNRGCFVAPPRLGPSQGAPLGVTCEGANGLYILGFWEVTLLAVLVVILGALLF